MMPSRPHPDAMTSTSSPQTLYTKLFCTTNQVTQLYSDRSTQKFRSICVLTSTTASICIPDVTTVIDLGLRTSRSPFYLFNTRNVFMDHVEKKKH